MLYFDVYLDVNRQYRWRLYAANHRIIAVSGEGYFNRADCLAAINLVKSTNNNTPVI